MLRAFAPHHFERWSYLLTRKPERWSKITPMLVWGGPDPFKSYPNMPFRELLASDPIGQFRMSPCVFLRCGHSTSPGVQTLTLQEAFPAGHWNYAVIHEGFVSIVPGKLALGFNHEGGVCSYGA
jgi:hypothetical protein